MLPSSWSIQLLGPLQARYGSTLLSRFRTEKTAALLGYLALHIGKQHSRELLAEMFWPERSPESGRLSLRVALASLRRQLEPPGVAAGSVLASSYDWISLNAASTGTDLQEFRSAVRTARSARAPDLYPALQAAASLYSGPFLLGFYYDWVLTERAQLQDAYCGVLQELLDLAEESGKLTSALEYAHAAAAVDPLEEGPQLRLIRIYAASGHQARAAEHCDTFARRISAELGLPESAELKRLRSSLPDLPMDAPAAAAHAPVEPVRTNAAPSPVDPNLGELHLPFLLTRFFDRADELEELQRMLSPTAPQRLITLTGTGGAGKTRLAIEAASRWHAAGGGPAWFVSLAEASNGTAAATAIATALDRMQDGIDPIASVAEKISGRATLLILDNMEQLADGAEFVHRLIASSIGLKVLATSRHLLGIDGEVGFTVAPLPAPHLPTTAERLVEFSSVQLFVDRAQAIRADFQVTPRNARAVGSLCNRLEGIPLAIELAAGWIQVLTPAQMLLKLERRFELLVSRRRDLDSRHRSLWETVDWSYSLLPASLQSVLRALSVFQSGFTTDALAAVCGLPAADAWRVLEELRSRSLITTVEADGEMRATMLETLREFAAALCSVEERLALTRRYAAYYAELAGRASTAATGREQLQWMRWLEPEVRNLQVAIRTCLDAEPQTHLADLALELTGWLWRPWFKRVRTDDMRGWITRALELGSRAPSEHRTRALIGAAAYAWVSGEHSAAREDAAGALQMSRQLRLRTEESEALTMLGIVAVSAGDDSFGMQCHEEALALRQRYGTPMQAANSLHNLAIVSITQYDLVRTRELLTEAEALQVTSEDDIGRCKSLLNLATVDLLQGDYQAAHRRFVSCLALARSAGLTIEVANALKGCAQADIELNRLEEAESALSEAMLIYRDLGDQHGFGLSLGSLGAIAWLRGERNDAADYARQSLELLRDVEGETEVTETLALLALTAISNTERAAVVSETKRAVARFQTPENGLAIVQAVDILCFVTLNAQNRRTAAEQVAIVEAWRNRTGCRRLRLFAAIGAGIQRKLKELRPAKPGLDTAPTATATDGTLASCAAFAAALQL